MSTVRSGPRSYSLALALLLGVGIPGCKGGDEAAAAGDTGKAGDGKGDPLSGIEAHVEAEVDKAAQEAGISFDPEDKEIRKRACEWLTAEMVEETFGVPAGELKQMKMMGCIYSWKNDDQTLNAQIMMPQVHKTEARAKMWFDNSTASKTKEELDAEMEMVKQKARERKEIDTKVKKKTVGTIGEMMKDAMPDEGVTYTDVSGIGDQARVSSADGSMRIRLGNLTFSLTAYHGPKEPKAKFDPKNPQAIAKEAIRLQKQWVKDTLDQRVEAVKKLAPRVVAAISAR